MCLLCIPPAVWLQGKWRKPKFEISEMQEFQSSLFYFLLQFLGNQMVLNSSRKFVQILFGCWENCTQVMESEIWCLTLMLRVRLGFWKFCIELGALFITCFSHSSCCNREWCVYFSRDDKVIWFHFGGANIELVFYFVIELLLIYALKLIFILSYSVAINFQVNRWFILLILFISTLMYIF